MKFLLSCLLFSACLLSVQGQALNDLEAMTDKHVTILGTNIAIVPPANFVPSENFKGFTHPENPALVVMAIDIPGPYSEVVKGFSKENQELMVGRGMHIQDTEEVTVGDNPGTLVHLEQMANGMQFEKYILIYGDTERTTFINGIFLKDSVSLGKEILASIRSTFIDEDLEVDPQAALNYRVNPEAGNYKLASISGNSMIMTRDGQMPPKLEDKSVLIVDKSLNSEPIEDKEGFCKIRWSELPNKSGQAEIPKTSPLKLGGLPGFLMKGDSEGEEVTTQIIIFPEEGGYFILLGIRSSEFPDTEKDMEKVMKTFVLKQE